MIRTIRAPLAALALGLATITFVPAAQAAPPAAQADQSYESLVTVLEGAPQQRATALEAVLDATIRGLATVAPIGEAMKANPGMAGEIREAIRPALADYSDKSRVVLRQEMLVVLSGGLSVAEARELAAFYRSPLGQRLMNAAISNYAPDQTMTDAIQKQKVDKSSVSADVYAAGLAGLGDLSTADQQAIITFSQTGAAKRFNALMPKLIEARTRVENAEPPAELRQAVSDALTPILVKYLGPPPGQ